jgi:hypothetical protein
MGIFGSDLSVYFLAVVHGEHATSADEYGVEVARMQPEARPFSDQGVAKRTLKGSTVGGHLLNLGAVRAR